MDFRTNYLPVDPPTEDPAGFRPGDGTADLIYDRGPIGREPMIRVLGRSPVEVVDKVLRIVSECALLADA